MVAITLSVKYPINTATSAARTFGLSKNTNCPVEFKKTAGKIIAGKTALGT
jgi:hypothetical protein